MRESKHDHEVHKRAAVSWGSFYVVTRTHYRRRMGPLSVSSTMLHEGGFFVGASVRREEDARAVSFSATCLSGDGLIG